GDLHGLLDERRRQGGRPLGREHRSPETRDDQAPPLVRDPCEPRGPHAAPHRGAEHERHRLALVQVEQVDREEQGEPVEEEQAPRKRPPRGRQLLEQLLLGDRVDGGDDHDRPVQPEGGLSPLEQRRLATPVARHPDDLRIDREPSPSPLAHQAISARSIMASISSISNWSCPAGAHPSKITPSPEGDTTAVTSPSIGACTSPNRPTYAIREPVCPEASRTGSTSSETRNCSAPDSRTSSTYRPNRSTSVPSNGKAATSRLVLPLVRRIRSGSVDRPASSHPGNGVTRTDVPTATAPSRTSPSASEVR